MTLLYMSAACGEKKTNHFDLNALRALGYSQDIADFFSEEARFLPGQHRITLLINAHDRYQLEARFNHQGRLCVDEELLRTLKLQNTTLNSDCEEFTRLWPQAQVKVHPGQFRVELTLPDTAFESADNSSQYQQGGKAILLNYSIFGYQVSNSGEQQRFYHGDIEPGINVNNWVLRSQGSFSYQTGSLQYRYHEVYALRPIDSLHAVLQMGQFGMAGSLFSALSVTGVQLYSDEEKLAVVQLVVPIQGVANTQATVEIRQKGHTIYRTVVPPGPFSLDKINAFDTGQEIAVHVLEDDGQQQHFILTNPQVEGKAPSADIYQIGVGRYGSPGQDNPSSPLVGVGEYSFDAGMMRRVTLGGLLAADYQNIALKTYPVEWLSTGVSAMNTRQGKRGTQFDGQVQTSLGDNFSGALSTRYRTRDYLVPDGVLSDPSSINRGLYGLRQAITTSLSWSYASWMALSYSVSYNSYYQAGAGRLSHMLSSYHQVGSATLSLGLQRSSYGQLSTYINFSMPFGKGNLNNQLQFNQGKMSLGSTYQGNLTDTQSYSVGITRSYQQQRVSGSTHKRTAYTQWAAGFSYLSNQNLSNQNHSLSLSGSGSMAYADGLFALSSAQIGDTFALMNVDEQANVPIHTSSSGATLTNWAGTVILPAVYPYSTTSARIETKALPLNIRLDTTTADFALARGTVTTKRISVTEMKQLLLTLRLPDGEVVPMGSTILDEQDHFLSTVLSDGNIMLTNEVIGKKMKVKLSDQKTCQVDYQVPTYFDPTSLYETADALCH